LWNEPPNAQRPGGFRFSIDNLPGALDWAFAVSGDAGIAVSLTAASVPLWHQQLVVKEYLNYAYRALARFGTGAKSDPRLEMQLRAVLGAPSCI
jgi:predicted ATPase